MENAFNTASWERICNSLDGRVPPYLFAVISDGLRDRVLICDTDEGRIELELSAGIAQGSVSGPSEWNTQYVDFLILNLPDGAELVGFADDAALVVVTKTAWEVECIGNEALYRVGQWFPDNHLELAGYKCEGMLVTKRRSFQMPVFTINGHVILLERELKYLGVWFDDKSSYKAKLREAALKADRVGSALQRLMPNIGGPKPNRRALLSFVSYSIMLYGAAIWGRIASGAVIDGKLGPVQRRLVLRTISA